MAQRNWNQLKLEWIAAGRPKLSIFAKQKRIPASTLRKQATRHKWRKAGALVDQKTQELMAATEAQRANDFRGRLILTGQQLAAKALAKLKVTEENALYALRLATALEAQGVYGPASMRGEGGGVVINQQTQVYVEAMNVAKGPEGKDRQALDRALEKLFDS